MNHPIAKREMSDRIAVFNIDGCISDDRWRRARVPEGANKPEHFDAYHAGASDDPPLQYGAAILSNHIANGDFIVFATGRKMAMADLTAKWIIDHFRIAPHEDFVILLRADNDERAVVDVKRDFANFLIQTFAPQREKKIIAAYDNRRDVVDMYNAAGIESTILNEDGEFIPQNSIVEVQSEVAKAPTAGILDSSSLTYNPASYQVAAPNTAPAEFLEETAGFQNKSRAEKGIPEKSNIEKYPKYFKDVSAYEELDVYLLLEIFEVTDHAIGHAIKKLLLAGVRSGGKPASKDIEEARDTLNRWLEIRSLTPGAIEHHPV